MVWYEPFLFLVIDSVVDSVVDSGKAGIGPTNSSSESSC